MRNNQWLPLVMMMMVILFYVFGWKLNSRKPIEVIVQCQARVVVQTLIVFFICLAIVIIWIFENETNHSPYDLRDSFLCRIIRFFSLHSYSSSWIETNELEITHTHNNGNLFRFVFDGCIESQKIRCNQINEWTEKTYFLEFSFTTNY